MLILAALLWVTHAATVMGTPEYPGQGTAPHGVVVLRSSSHLENLEAAEKLATDFVLDTSFNNLMTFLDARPHYNALLTVLFAMAENNVTPLCGEPDNDFNTNYENRYIDIIEKFYPHGLFSPDLISHKVKYYNKLFSENIRNMKHLIEVECVTTGLLARCDELLGVGSRTSPALVREASVLQALAVLSASYDQISSSLKRVSEQYLELPYLLRNKEELRDFVRKLYYVMEITSLPYGACTT